MAGGAEVHVALLTPADAAGELDEPALAAHVRWLADARVDGLLVAGTTGEGPLLDEGEVARAVACARAAAPDLRLFAGVGRPATRATIRLARMAVEAGADAVAAVVPYFYEVEDEGLLRHFTAVADAVVPVPLIAYNIPSRTGNDLVPGLLDRLLGEGVAGLKDSTKSLERHREYLDVVARHPGAQVFMGSDGLALEALRSATHGLMSGAANIIPARVVALRDAAGDGDRQSADAIQREILATREQTQGPAQVVALKQLVADALAGTGHRYPPFARAPLG